MRRKSNTIAMLLAAAAVTMTMMMAAVVEVVEAAPAQPGTNVAEKAQGAAATELPDPLCVFHMIPESECTTTTSSTTRRGRTNPTDIWDTSSNTYNFTFFVEPLATAQDAPEVPKFTLSLPLPSTTTIPSLKITVDEQGADPTGTPAPFIIFPAPPDPDDDDGENSGETQIEPGEKGPLGCHNGIFGDGFGDINCSNFSVMFGVHKRHQIFIRASNFRLEERVKCKGDRWKSIKSPLPYTVEVHGGLRCDSPRIEDDNYANTFLSYADLSINIDHDPRCKPTRDHPGMRCILPQKP